MKSIVSVNFSMPDCEYLDYFDGRSLRDFDIVLFAPSFPYLERTYFNAGGSCISPEAGRRLIGAINHWNQELKQALVSGKTVFIISDSVEEDIYSAGTESKRKNETTHLTRTANSYSAIPAATSILGPRSTKGRVIKSNVSLFKNFVSAAKELLEYRVIFGSIFQKGTEICAKDGTPVGGVLRFKDLPGALVFLPYFDFSADTFVESDGDGDAVWSSAALNLSKAIKGQISGIDRALRKSGSETPPPDWISAMPVPEAVSVIKSDIEAIEQRIAEAKAELGESRESLIKALSVQDLLFENGVRLERAIDRVLNLMGFSVDSLRIGDLEIDHIVVGPSGKRMIGETEGKDKSAVDITKFRQLESNIGEDFERDGVDEPAKGLLFANGFRFTNPSDRPEQFTDKSLTNARRLGTALIRTSDLYAIAVHLLDHPDDEVFKSECREAIESTSGDIVKFPSIP